MNQVSMNLNLKLEQIRRTQKHDKIEKEKIVTVLDSGQRYLFFLNYDPDREDLINSNYNMSSNYSHFINKLNLIPRDFLKTTGSLKTYENYMSLEIKTPNGKLFGLADCEEEFVIVNNKKVLLQDVYQDDKLLSEFNDEIKTSEKDNQDVENK